jgi:hypothetical protein
MKKKEINNKLVLNKKTVVNLEIGAMQNIKGGDSDGQPGCRSYAYPTNCLGPACFQTYLTNCYC